jgi:hypothetical protein
MVAAVVFGVVLTPSLWAIFQTSREKIKTFIHMKTTVGILEEGSELQEE